MLTSYLTGLLVCGGIIIAIGAQNAYILGQAIRREHHWYCAGICMTADILLFTAGMFGVNAALMAVPEALDVMRWLGVAFLSWLALLAFTRAAKGRDALDARKADVSSLRTVVLTTLAVTLLNPQVYLDTLLLIPAVRQLCGSACWRSAGRRFLPGCRAPCRGGSLMAPLVP